MIRWTGLRGDTHMTNANDFGQKALASLTALFASWLLVSAAIGPVLPIA